ncbi:hypothetical protein BU17DRAFT_63729 [Hysterangium stoloniferum]|nr:hypothetical protein BU17DRAFT_71862 [Hysterangium stoloniferum]KAF8523801.1 hypothetical protein BU17DRAFT_63729 [Hysterangium stoloniferum]
MSGVPYQKARYTCPGSILFIKPGISNHNNPSPTRFGVPSALMCKWLLGPVGMVMPEEDGTTGTQDGETTWRSILPICTVTFKRIGSSPVDCVQVGWRLKILLWEFAEAVGEGSSMEGQEMIASIEDTGPFKETQSSSLMYTTNHPRQLSAG